MNKLGIEPIQAESLHVEVADAQDGLLITFDGDIDMENPGALLDPLFESVHQGAVNQNAEWVSADFRQLKFLNSSGIKAIAKWIIKLDPSKASYKIRLLYNKDETWQATSLRTLTFLMPGSVTME